MYYQKVVHYIFMALEPEGIFMLILTGIYCFYLTKVR